MLVDTICWPKTIARTSQKTSLFLYFFEVRLTFVASISLDTGFYPIFWQKCCMKMGKNKANNLAVSLNIFTHFEQME